jgi:hypothetical protein
MNDLLCYQWIQHFHLATRGKTVGTHRLLLCDGYGSHLTYELVKFCEEKDIILFFLPPKTSHYLQPLDVGVFHAYKHWHSEAIADATATGCGKFTKVEFLYALSTIRKKTFKPRTIRHGFRDTGIVPFNPQVVLAVLPDQPQTPVSSSGSGSALSGNTPQTTRKVEAMWDALIEQDDDIHFFDILNKLQKSAIAQAHLVDTLRRELTSSEQAKMARQRRAQASHRQISYGGVVRSADIRKMVRKEQEYDEIRELLKLRKKWKLVMAELIDVCLTRGIITKCRRKSRQ